MATTKKTTKKTVKKAAAKKVAPKRTYTRKKADVLEQGPVEAVQTEQAASPTIAEQLAAANATIETQQATINQQAEGIGELISELCQPSNIGDRLSGISPIVYLDTAHLNTADNAIVKCTILHVLGRDGYVTKEVAAAAATREKPYGDRANLASLAGFSLLAGYGILKLNTVNRTAEPVSEKDLPEGTELVRINIANVNPAPKVEDGARIVSHTHTIDGVVYKRAYGV